jgi:hypothetical protein
MALTIIHTADLHDRLDRARSEALGFLREQYGRCCSTAATQSARATSTCAPREPVHGR